VFPLVCPVLLFIPNEAKFSHNIKHTYGSAICQDIILAANLSLYCALQYITI
jgi:hypothetical protein